MVLQRFEFPLQSGKVEGLEVVNLPALLRTWEGDDG